MVGSFFPPRIPFTSSLFSVGTVIYANTTEDEEEESCLGIEPVDLYDMISFTRYSMP